MRQLLLAVLVLSIITLACNTHPDVAPDMAGMMRTGKWKISAGTVTLRQPNGVKKDQTYWPNLRKICLRDDYIVFDSSNIGSVHNGGTSCSLATADSINFIWQLKNNGGNIDLLNIYTVVDSVAQTVYLDNTVTPNIYKIRYDTATSRTANIVNATIKQFSQSSFVLEYPHIGQYLDTTGGHQASPVAKPDTFIFHVTYSNF